MMDLNSSHYCYDTNINSLCYLLPSQVLSVCVPVQAIKSLQYETGKVPVDYEENFRRADHTFLYQVVFDPRTQQQVRLNEVPHDIDLASFEFAGTYPSTSLTLYCIAHSHYFIP